MIDLSRDETARPELVRRLIRAGRLDRLTASELRDHAWRLIQSGVEYVATVDGEARPLIHGSGADHLGAPVSAPRALTAPIQVELLWDDRRARLFAADCAEHVLPFFGRAHPGDDRPSRAIEAARAYARGEIDAAARAAARDAASAAASAAAWDSAWDSAWDAASAAAMSAASAAAWDAASAAARDAAGGEEREWQSRRLLAYLLGQVAI